jgi:predicted NBD/HSP70 family sugar kinase
VYPGRTGNAGALGSLPVGTADGAQLLETASLYQLERALMAAGYPREALWEAEDTDWSGFGDIPEPWIADTVSALARASVAVCSVIDFEAIVIDGRLPGLIRQRIVTEVAAEITRRDTQGIASPRVVAGTMGRRAGVVGAAYQPILRRYLHGGAGLV